MLIKNEKIEIRVNGKTINTLYLNKRHPRIAYYFENDDITDELAKGKNVHSAQLEAQRRQAITLFNAAFQTVQEIASTDESAAASLIEEFIDALYPYDGDEDEDEDLEPVVVDRYESTSQEK